MNDNPKITLAGVLSFDDLRSLSRLGPRATLATVERWATKEGIRYRYDGRGGIWTTIDALNAALGLSPCKAADEGMYPADMVG